MQSLLLKLTALCAIVASVHSFAINVDAHEKECFYDDVKAGTKMGLTFQVADGGFLDIDVSVGSRLQACSFYVLPLATDFDCQNHNR
jgi:hypothetical protein